MIGVTTGTARNQATGERRVYLEAQGSVEYLTWAEALDLVAMLRSMNSDSGPMARLADDIEKCALKISTPGADA